MMPATCDFCTKPKVVTVNGVQACQDHIDDALKPVGDVVRGLRALAEEWAAAGGIPPTAVELQRLPCGCRISSDPKTRAFLIEPCSLTCEYYLYSLDETQRQGKQVVAIDVRPSS